MEDNTREYSSVGVLLEVVQQLMTCGYWTHCQAQWRRYSKDRSMLLASERSERDTIRGVQFRAGAIYIYGYVCAIIVAHAIHTYCGRS